MAKIFISYRPQDSAGVAWRIHDRLSTHFGKDAVLMDIDASPSGVDFRKVIDATVGQCDVALAVIGTKWAGDTDTPRRIDDPRDFVRIELESVFQRNLPVIPILIDDTPMPREADLPPSLTSLAFRHAIDVHQGQDLHRRFDVLIREIELRLQPVKFPGTAAYGQPQQAAISSQIVGASLKRHSTLWLWSFVAILASLAFPGIVVPLVTHGPSFTETGPKPALEAPAPTTPNRYHPRPTLNLPARAAIAKTPTASATADARMDKLDRDGVRPHRRRRVHHGLGSD